MGYVFGLLLILLSSLAYSSPAEEREEFRIAILDRVQEMFGARFNFAANRLDSFFATDRADDELGRSRIRIRSRYTMMEHAPGDLNNVYRINLKLPHLEDRFQWDYYQDEEKKKKGKNNAKKNPEQYPGNELDKRWLFNSDLAFSASIPPRLTARARLRKSFETGTVIHRFVEQLTYITDERGLGNELSLTSDQTLSDVSLFRFLNLVRWRISEKDFFTQHGPSILHQITDDDAISYGASLFTTIENSRPFLTNYQVSTNYRRNLYRQWLYFDTITGLDFPKQFKWDANPFLIFQLEILLGH